MKDERLISVSGGAMIDPRQELTRRAALSRALRLAAAAIAGTHAASVLTGPSRGRAWAQSIVASIRGLPPEITSNDKFYTVSKNFIDPDVNVRNWRLDVGGMVDEPFKLTLDDVKKMPAVTRPHTYMCISNEVGADYIGNAVWKGVRVADVLARAKAKSGANRVIMRAADGFHTALPLAQLLDPDVLLLYEMNGVPLPKAHGYPLRICVPGIYGMKQPKWIHTLELTDKDHKGYWEQQGWTNEAVVRTMSQFRSHKDGAVVAAGRIGLGGVAFAANRGIAAVEYSTDGGKTWQPAEVKRAMGKHTWSLWGAFWDAKPGRYSLQVRARDGAGELQDPTARPTLPDGATGYHTLRVTVK
jgi:DMSO/TMAO reductase YedYZ molybdopterin-dependent catalytic subunit